MPVGEIKHSKAIMIYVKKDLLPRIEKYWHKHSFLNRNRTIQHLIEYALDHLEEKDEE